jgi:hypothetical protein
MDDQKTDERRREAYRNAASNLLAFGYEATAADPVEWHVPPEDADWSAHIVDQFCGAHMASAARGEVPYGGALEYRPTTELDSMPEWRRKLADRPPMADWWRRRHHCSEAVLGAGREPDRATSA